MVIEPIKLPNVEEEKEFYKRVFSKFIIDKDGKCLYDKLYASAEASKPKENTESELFNPISVPVVDEYGRVVENAAVNHENEEPATFIPFIIEPDEKTVVVDFSSNTKEDAATESDDSNPYLTMKRQEAETIKLAQESTEPKTDYIDNAEIISVYPQLEQIQAVIRETNLDCKFVQRPDKLIAVCVVPNGSENVIATASFMVDFENILLGPEHKWFNTFIGPNESFGALETFFAIRTSNLDMIKKHVLQQTTIEDLKYASIYPNTYLAVNDIVELNSFPTAITADIKTKIVERLYKAIGAGVFDIFRNRPVPRFVVNEFVDLHNFILKSENFTIVVKKDSIEVIENS